MTINELYAQVQAGDAHAERQLFNTLAERFSYFVHRKVVSREDVQEITQDALTSISQSMRSIEIETSFSAWAYRILENRVAQYYRSRRLHRDKMAEYLQGQADTGVQNPDPELRRQLLVCLKKVCSAFPRHARVLNLHYQGYRSEEICERMGLSRNNMYIILSRTRSMMKLCLRTGGIQ